MSYKEGDIITGLVSGIKEYGIFIQIDSEVTGMIHISEISKKFVKDINNITSVGDTLKVEIKGINPDKTLNLSIKNIKKQQKKIKETPLGFSTLEAKLPIWIEEYQKKYKKEQKKQKVY